MLWPQSIVSSSFPLSIHVCVLCIHVKAWLCTCSSTDVKDRKQPQVSVLIFYLLLFAAEYTRIADERILSSSLKEYYDYRYIPPHPEDCVFWRFKLRCSCWSCKQVIHCTISPAQNQKGYQMKMIVLKYKRSICLTPFLYWKQDYFKILSTFIIWSTA